ncbi:hypothetical protein AAVH_15157 [Aphelenchoides avenae]|nr:hypothetical protein AAVH_15157 [Aphelenchus avenae]
MSYYAHTLVVLGQLCLGVAATVHYTPALNETAESSLVKTGMHYTVDAEPHVTHLLQADSSYAAEFGPFAHDALYIATTYLGKSFAFAK